MRVAIVAPLFAPLLPAQPYGPHAFLIDLARSLAARGHAVSVYCAAGSRIPGLELHTVPVSPLVGHARVITQPGAAKHALPAAARSADHDDRVATAVREAFLRAYEEVDRHGADVISQHAFDAQAIELAEGRAVLHTLHLPPIVPAVVSAAAATRARLATVSEACRRDWETAGVAIPLVLRNGVAAWDPGRPEVEPVALMAGRVSREKGVAVGIRAALRAGLRPRVVGEPYDRGYFDAEVVPLLGSVELVPTVPREELWRLMARAAVTLMPIAWEEPFGLVAAEAQMSGCPLVGYRRGALPEVVEEGVSGLLVEPNDEDALVRAIGAARRLDREQVKASARRRLGLEASVDTYERALGEIAAASAPS